MGQARQRELEPSVVTYNDAGLCFEQGQQWALVLELLTKMPEGSVTSSPVMYHAALSTCGSARRWQAAFGLVGDLRRKGCETSVITQAFTIGLCEKGQQWELAAELLSQGHSESLDSDAMTSGS